MSVLKQVIVLRKDLNMRKGKMVAQGCHASLNAYLSAIDRVNDQAIDAYDWMQNHKQTKICVGVESEAELFAIHMQAQLAGIPTYLVLDAAHTEFKEPTYTSCALGPASAEKIDKITGNLKLL